MDDFAGECSDSNQACGGCAYWGGENTGGYLSNGGFEGDFYAVEAGQVAEGWTRVNLTGNPNWMSTKVFADGGWVEKIGAGSEWASHAPSEHSGDALFVLRVAHYRLVWLL